MFGKKLLEYVSPYHRIFLTIQLEDNDIISLPAVQTATFFLTGGDVIMLDSLDNLDELVFIDYSLLDKKNGEPRFIEDFDRFKELVRKSLLQQENNNLFKITINNKVIYGKNANILCSLI